MHQRTETQAVTETGDGNESMDEINGIIENRVLWTPHPHPFPEHP